MLQFIILVVPSLNGVLNLNVHHHYYFISVMDGSYVFIKKSSYQEWRLNQCGNSHWSGFLIWTESFNFGALWKEGPSSGTNQSNGGKVYFTNLL